MHHSLLSVGCVWWSHIFFLKIIHLLSKGYSVEKGKNKNNFTKKKTDQKNFFQAVKININMTSNIYHVASLCLWHDVMKMALYCCDLPLWNPQLYSNHETNIRKIPTEGPAQYTSPSDSSKLSRSTMKVWENITAKRR